MRKSMVRQMSKDVVLFMWKTESHPYAERYMPVRRKTENLIEGRKVVA